MISIPSNQPSQQDQTVTILRAQLAKAQTRIQALEARLKWEDELFANPHLSPGHKLTLRAAYTAVQRKATPQDELTKIFIPAIAEKIGLSAKTVGKNLQYLADTGAIVREAETETDATGQRITRVSIGLTEQIKRPDHIIPPQPRNHGGLREYCPACGSENLLEEKKIICTDCGTVISSIQRLISQESTDGQDEKREVTETPAPPINNLTPLLKPKVPTDNLTAGEKPTTPPGRSAACSTNAADIITWQQMRQEQEQPAAPGAAEQKTERELYQAARLLLDIAGDHNEHIVMNTNPRTPKKYLTVHRPLTHADMLDHLAGRKTLGGRLTHQDGTTRALCFDTDDNPTDSVTWRDMKDAAQQLSAAGYTPLLEPSPAKRGGHLWLIFTERVNASAAYQQVCELAPQLKDVGEHWPPQRGNQKVRLPAGKYVTPTFSEWTHLVDAQNNILAQYDLLMFQTSATLIPAPAADEHEPDEAQEQERSSKRQHNRPVTTTPDEQHRSKYGKHAMWVAWPNEEYLIQRFNEQNTIDDLATSEASGMINAATIGRPERTASVGITPDGQRFTDFGAGAKQPDGHQDGGDPFEFYIRSAHKEKKDVLRDLGRALNREASSELLRAARSGEQPPAWVMDILTDKGRAIYNENAQKNGYPPLDEHTRGRAT